MSLNFVNVFKIFILILICSNSCHNAQEAPNKHSDSMPSISAVLLEGPKELNQKSYEPQLMINIRVNPSFNIKQFETFLILDEVYHPHKRVKAKILAPYLIEISRGEPVMMYPLQFTKSVHVGNGMIEPDIQNENGHNEHKNCHANSNNNEQKQSVDNAKMNPHNSSISTTTSLHQKLTFSDRKNSPKQQTVNKVIQKVKEAFSPITKKNENQIKLVSQNNSHKTKTSMGHIVLGTPINMKTRMQNDHFEVDGHKNRIHLPLKYKNKMFQYHQTPNKMEDKTKKMKFASPFGMKHNPYKNIFVRPDITTNVAVEGNLRSQLQKQQNFGQLGQMKMLHRNRTLPQNSQINELSNYYVSDSNSDPMANRYSSGFTDKNMRNSISNDSPLGTIMDSNDLYDSKIFKQYPLLTASSDKPELHMFADGGDMFVEKPLNLGRVPSIETNFLNSYGGQRSGVNDHQPRFYSTNISLPSWQEISYQNSVFDSLSSETNKNQKGINRAADEDGENKMSPESDTKRVENSDFQYQSDFKNVGPLDKSINDNSLQESLSSQSSLDSPQERTKQKRSYLFYDDMEMTDNLDNNEDIYEHLSPVQDLSSEEEFNDVQPCDTCGGKGKKPPGKGGSEVPSSDSRINNCNCRSKRIKCSCVPNKMSQSVGDAWYSVFKMNSPLPFLTTKLRIFQKRRGTWWKIAPSITLNSLSGIFANANLSILFSSHVDIFQLEKSLRLQNHQLFIPKEDRPTRENRHESHINIEINKQKSNSDIEYIEHLNFNPEKILAINSTKPKLITNFLEFHGDLLNNKINNILQSDLTRNPRIIRNIDDNTEHTSVRKIAELGYFPTSMNMLERCPNNMNRLCLNMLDDIVPAFTIKVKMPFRENAVVFSNFFKIKITKVISDTTTKDALQISVDVINEGIESREFSISLHNCPTACATAAKTSVQKFLLPHVGETINFLLPLIVQTNNLKQNKFHCEVLVKTLVPNDSHSDSHSDSLKKQEAQDRLTRTQTNSSHINIKANKEVIVAVRQLTIELGNRCLCVWKCHCHCLPKLETYVDFNICQELDINSEYTAGLLLNSTLDNNNGNDNTETGELDSSHTYFDLQQLFQYNGGFLWNALLLLLLMILIGLLKAIFGICVTPIDKCGYDYVQPGRTYNESSKCRHFCVNAFFFIIIPFLFWCKCFTPSAEDLLVASTEWTCHSSSAGSGKKGHNTYKCLCSDDEDEDVLFAQHIQGQSQTNKTQSHFNDKCSSHYRKNYQTFLDTDPNNAGENVILLKNANQKSSKHITGSRLEGGENMENSIYEMYDFELALNDDIFDDDEELNTKFILKALAESRESLKQLINNQSISLESINEENNLIRTSAEELVQKLNAVQIVYRTFNKPIGNLKNIPTNFKYCIQGYFLPSVGVGYEFVNYNPLAQHRCVSMDGKTIQVLRPPNLLCPKDFSRRYVDKYEVLNVGDLTEHPPEHVPCINISALAAVATSVAKLASDQNSRHDVLTTSTCLRSTLDLHDRSSCIILDNKIFEPDVELYAAHSYPSKEIGETYLINNIEPLDHDLLQSNEAVNTSNEYYSSVYKVDNISE